MMDILSSCIAGAFTACGVAVLGVLLWNVAELVRVLWKSKGDNE